jgi:hypothetical protein
MPLGGTNVDEIINTVYTNGFIRHNRYEIDMTYTDGSRMAVPAFSVRLPGWDIATVTDTEVGPNIRTMPYRKNWNQSLFITFYMSHGTDSIFDFISKWNNSVVKPEGPAPFYIDRVKPCSLQVHVGENDNVLTWDFQEVYPRVLYPIDLKPVEDFAPFIFSVQFVYRYFDNRANGTLLG